MKKILLILAIGCTLNSNAEEPQGSKTCVKSEWQTPIIVYGKSKETCVQNNSDGSKTVTQTSCTTKGVSASVKGIGYKSVATTCEEPKTKTIPAKSSTTNTTNSNN